MSKKNIFLLIISTIIIGIIIFSIVKLDISPKHTIRKIFRTQTCYEVFQTVNSQGRLVFLISEIDYSLCKKIGGEKDD